MILDNFEQVARHAEETLGRWLNRAGDARFLVTTREVLGLPGEEVFALTPLAASDAASLFLIRAEAAKPGFAPSAEDQAAITPLVKLLEGLPLAIELAAARVRVMPPRMLLQRMSERFKLLSSTGGRLDRQATLRAVFDWSWDLLSVAEKAALAQLSVFEGGFTLESVEAVLDLSPYENAAWTMDVLQSLVHKSFVRPVTDTRFDLLVSVQEYAAEHLRTAARYEGSGPAALLEAEMRHGAYFAGLDEKAAVADGCAELDNLVVACRRAAARGDVDYGSACAGGGLGRIENARAIPGRGRSRIHGTGHLPARAGAWPLKWIGLPALRLTLPVKDAEARAQFEGHWRGPARWGPTLRVPCARSLGFLDCHARQLAIGSRPSPGGVGHRTRTERSGRFRATPQQHWVTWNNSWAGRSRHSSITRRRWHWPRGGDRHREGGVLGNLGKTYAETGNHGQSPRRVTKRRSPWHGKWATGDSKATRFATSACCTTYRDESQRLLIDSKRRWQWPETWATPAWSASCCATSEWPTTVWPGSTRPEISSRRRWRSRREWELDARKASF